MTSHPAKVISGGQTGADLAALEAARMCGLSTGGWCPPDQANEAGSIDPDFGLQPTDHDHADDAPNIPRSERTLRNVRESDGTVILHLSGLESEDPGTEYTVACALRLKKPLLVVDAQVNRAAEKITAWIERHDIHILNVAGPAESQQPGLGEAARAVLTNVFETLKAP